MNVTVNQFDAQFLHGTLEIKKKDSDFKTDIKLAFQLSKPRHNQAQHYVLTGTNEPIATVDKNLFKTSALVSNARYRSLRPSQFSISDDSVTITFGQKGKLMLKK